MNRAALHIAILVFVGCLPAIGGKCQESIFTALKSNLKRGDEYFQDGRYAYALELYLAKEKTNKATDDIGLKIARTYYKLKDNENVVSWYKEYLLGHTSLPTPDSYDYAEALSSLGRYEAAIEQYKKYLKKNPKDNRVTRKIWRLKNVKYLYEDSIYYAVKPLNLNSEYGEFGARYFENNLVFVSNRKASGSIAKMDGGNDISFQALYVAEIRNDSTAGTFGFSLGKPKPLFKGPASKFHRGMCAFFQGGDKMIYTKSARGKGGNLQLFIAEKKDGTWKDDKPFAHNKPHHSICHPTLSMDGKTLFFASDMPGGKGGKDLYRCSLVNGEWTEPENLGDKINTEGDESFPYFHASGVLYFASTGHGGLGGLDIFKVAVNGSKTEAVENAGYPINTSFDDFAIVLNDEGSHGFLSSNRNNGKFNDDIFALKIDLQTYPLTISGVLKYKTIGWQDSSGLVPLPHAELHLIDNHKNETVFTTSTDESGYFALNIPYSSQYKIKVFEKDIGHKLVSLEIPRNRKMYTNHEIVIVNDRFNQSGVKPAESTRSDNSGTRETNNKLNYNQVEGENEN
ncbi:tetratricopeptide repeat protein [Fulvivirgaceae bacterium BMA12]|uniref:Tetratricopeptide repeat protein n=1 Tax=Agaribacillus aureus TaxID=3051825 RepID=A0ABT8L5Q6_9BACT|nr:tetratricopeptide repeat protein [Fulvivirgaceae bacterium BMA12]